MGSWHREPLACVSHSLVRYVNTSYLIVSYLTDLNNIKEKRINLVLTKAEEV
jgi:hypothetical protein